MSIRPVGGLPVPPSPSKKRPREDDESPPPAKRGRHEDATWRSEETNFLMAALPQLQSAPNPYRPIEIDVVTGLDEEGKETTIHFEMPRPILTALSEYFQTELDAKMRERDTGAIVWKGTGTHPYIHPQAAVHIVQYAHLKCRAVEKEKCRTLGQLKQQYPAEFDEILADIVRLCAYFKIGDLHEICEGFIREECRADPSNQIPAYFLWALGKLETRPIFQSMIKELSTDATERESIYSVLVAIFHGDYTKCSLEEKLFAQRFARDCFFGILPDEPDDEELLDIYGAIADLFPDFDFTSEEMARMAEFSFSAGVRHLIHMDPHLQRKQQAAIVGRFFQRAVTLIYEGQVTSIVQIEWSVPPPLERKYKPYRDLLEVLGREGFLMPNGLVWLSDFLSTHPHNVFARKVRSMILQKSDLDAARADMEKALESYPDDPDLLTMRGSYRLKQGDRNSSLDDYNRALDVDPTFIPARFERSNYYHTIDKKLESIRDMDRAIAIEPSARLFKHRAWLYHLFGDHDKALQDISRAYRGNMHDVETLLIRALIHKAKKNWSEAFDDANRACIRAPHLPYPLLLRALIFQEVRRFDEALTDYDNALTTPRPKGIAFVRTYVLEQADTTTIRYERARCLMLMGDAVCASLDFKRILEETPSHLPSLLGLARCHRMQGNFCLAWDCYTNAMAFDPEEVKIDLFVSSSEHPDDPGLLALLASYHAEMDELTEAEALFKRVGAQPNLSSQVLALRATFQAERGNPEEAIKDSSEALDKHPQNTHALMAKARARIAIGKLELAMADLDLVKEANETAYFLRILLHQKALNLNQVLYLIEFGNVQSILRRINREIRLNIEDPDLDFLRAVLFWAGRDYSQAERDLDTVLAMRPGDCQAMVLKAHCKRAQNDFDSCCRLLDSALADHPTEVFNTLGAFRLKQSFQQTDLSLMRGYCHLHLGQNREAFDDFKKTLRFNPDDHHALRLRSKCYRLLGHPGPAWDDCLRLIDLEESDEILSDLNQEIESNPRNRTALTVRAQYSMQIGDLNLAVIDCTTILEFDSGDADTYFLRAKCYQIQGEIDLAWQDISKAIELGIEPDVFGYLTLGDFTYSDNPNFSIFLGRYHLQKNDIIRASVFFEKALRIEPANIHALRGQGDTFRAASKKF